MKIGIMGYGNLGRGVECAVLQNKDIETEVIFTRRNPQKIKTLTSDVPVVNVSEIEKYRDKIDVLIICGGSATDLPEQTPKYAKMFNVIDSFDTHARIPEHFANVDKSAQESGHTAIISAGWDPGLFSLNRMYANAILPEGTDYTFWGKGVSQGHSDAIRRIKGVKNAKQYTIPVEKTVNRIIKGETPVLSAREKHTRECFVVLEEGADAKTVEHEIVTMPHYFDEYDTTVHFITEDEFLKNHTAMPHGGFVLRNGKTGLHKENTHIIEYKLQLDSNPEFTGSVLVSFARAVHRLNKEGQIGCKTIFDIAPAYLSPKSDEELRRMFL